MDTSASEYLKGAIEALLFISEKPVLLEHIADVMQESVGPVDVRQLIEALRDEYETKQRGMVIVEVAGGYQMLSSPHYVSYVRNFLKTKVKEKLSRPALETLAIVAYKQPVSRGDIELVRGVNSDGVVLHLLNKSLIKIVGKKDVPGRPYLYGTSKLFLEYFGLKSLRDLPKIEDVSLLLANSDNGETVADDSPDAVSQEQTALSASRALDEAEKQEIKKGPMDEPFADGAGDETGEEGSPSASQEPAEIAEHIAEHLQAARQNVDDILPAESSSNSESVESLKDAFSEIQRADAELPPQDNAPSRLDDKIMKDEETS